MRILEDLYLNSSDTFKQMLFVILLTCTDSRGEQQSLICFMVNKRQEDLLITIAPAL